MSSSGTRHTFKQELITRITGMVRRSSLDTVPPSCLKDMSTSSLSAFQEWLEPLLKANPPLIPSTHRLPKRKDE